MSPILKTLLLAAVVAAIFGFVLFAYGLNSVSIVSANIARYQIRVTAEQIAALEAKPRAEWTDDDVRRYEQARETQEAAVAELAE